jgi:hypothetical protein
MSIPKQTVTSSRWTEELGYVRSVSIHRPGASFNFDPECFARYCDMQANSARADGEREIANELNGIAVAALMVGRAVRQHNQRLDRDERAAH